MLQNSGSTTMRNSPSEGAVSSPGGGNVKLFTVSVVVPAPVKAPSRTGSYATLPLPSTLKGIAARAGQFPEHALTPYVPGNSRNDFTCPPGKQAAPFQMARLKPGTGCVSTSIG